MTQIVGVPVTAGMASKVSATKQQKTEELVEAFAGLMNQNAQNLCNADAEFQTRTEEMADTIDEVSDCKSTSKEEYEKYGSSVRKSVKTDKAEAKPEMKTENISESVEELTEDVLHAVQETMQVSEEELQQAMQTLGISPMDLLQPQNLIQLLQQLSGSEDVSLLLTSERVQLTMQNVNGLLETFRQENSLSVSEFSKLMEQLSAEIDKMEQTVKEMLGSQPETEQTVVNTTDTAEEDLASILAKEQELTDAEQTTEVTENVSDTVQSVPEEQQKETQTVSQSAETEEPLMTVSAKAKTETMGQEMQDANGGLEQKNESQTSQTQSHFTEREDMFAQDSLMNQNPVVTGENASVSRADAPQVAAYIQVEQLMEQMDGLARAFATTEGTTLEMQLNPENLGKLVLSVTEKHGNVTAQITASNEQVKEALQTQMVELRATLQAQGIKVEAVEVTVATHEFEQNLDGNTSANGQMQEQAERQMAGQSGRRNLNRNSLDELSGLMTEEEALVAQMMRDQGGSVDFTA
ncbi:MAG: flagellar hook-length control protein FliK [Eubacterium sp.]|nr:flagellar hook-length control protein FliK [Eubacterium sp.]